MNAFGFSTLSDRGVRSGAYLQAQDDLRRRLGRALHDSTGQLLLSLSLSFAHFRRSPHDSRLDVMLDEMGETISQISREIRTFSFLEYPTDLRSEGLVAALESFVTGFAKRTGLKVHFEARQFRDGADSQTALALLRIGQEALVNVHRYANASEVHLTLVESADELELVVKDNGNGVPDNDGSDDHHGVGIAGMRQRAESLGGRLTLGALKHGTKLVATIPARATATG